MADWAYRSDRRPEDDGWLYRSAAYVAGATVTSVSGTIAPGNQVTLNLAGFGGVATGVTFGGVAVTINSTPSVDQVVVTLNTRATLPLVWGATHVFSVTDGTDTAESSAVTLNAPTGWTYINYVAPPAPEPSDSFREYAGGTAADGDQLQHTSADGLTVDNKTRPFVALPYTSATVTFAWLDVSEGTRSAEQTIVVTERDWTPAALGFNNVTGATASTLTQSNLVTPTGYTETIDVEITGGEYSVAGGAYTSAAGTINPGQSLRLRATSAGTYPGVVTVTIRLGLLTEEWTITNLVSTQYDVSVSEVLALNDSVVESSGIVSVLVSEVLGLSDSIAVEHFPADPGPGFLVIIKR